MNKANYPNRDNADYDLIKKTKSEDAFVQLLHKTNYSFEGNEMAYIMFTANVKDIPFSFPTLLSLIKKDNKWFIHQRPNQQKLNNCLIMFKPCVLSNLIAGESDDKDIQNLIHKTILPDGSIDFIKLFDELVLIQENKQLSAKLTMTENANCESIKYKNKINSKITFTGIYNNLTLESFKNQDPNMVSLIKKNNDSIVLKSKLDVDYQNKKITLIKYLDIKKDGTITIKTSRLDINQIEDQPIKELLFLFKQLNTSIFSDLTPSLSIKPIANTEIYKKSRGVYDVLNITKLYSLYNTNPDLFIKYLE